MRILFLTPCLPNPNGVGWQQRSFRHLMSLAALGTVDTLILAPSNLDAPDDFASAAALSASLSVGPLSTAYDDQKKRYLSEPSALRRLQIVVRQLLPHTVRPIERYEAPQAAKAIPEADYDVVFCFRMTSAQWLQSVRPFTRMRHAAMVIDFDDIESRWHRQAHELERKKLSLVWRLQKKRDVWLLQNVENRWLRSSRPVLCCSEADATLLRKRVRKADVHVVPNSIPVSVQLPAVEPHDGFVVLFVGALNNDPNRDGLQFFVREVWPRVRSSLGERAKLHVVGRDPAPDVVELDGRDGVHIIGSVPTTAPHYARADVCIAPIRFGSGTRTKILEAFAHGRPVVSTTLGAEGLDAPEGRAILIANDAHSYAEAILRLQRDEAERHRIAQAAHQFVRERYAEEVIAPRLQSVVRSAVGQVARRAVGQAA